jgi:hypothetical protein
MIEQGMGSDDAATLRERLTAISDMKKALGAPGGSGADVVVSRVADITRAERCALFLVNPKGLRAGRRGKEQLKEEDLTPGEMSALQRAFSTGKAARGEDSPLICTPFLGDGGVTGAVLISRGAGGPFSPDEEEFMEDLAAELKPFIKGLAARPFSDDEVKQAEERPVETVMIPQPSKSKVEEHRDLSDKEKIFSILKNLDFFSVLTMDDIEKMLPELRKVTFERGAYAVRQGNAGGALFLVASGRFSVWIKPEKGEEVKVGDIGPLEYFGEMSLVTGEPRAASVKAEEKAEIYILSREIFDTMLIGNPVVSQRIREVIRERRRKNEMLLSPAQKEAPKGLFGFLRRP